MKKLAFSVLLLLIPIDLMSQVTRSLVGEDRPVMTHSLVLGERIDMYNCDYLGRHEKVVASKFNFTIKRQKSDGMICISKTSCDWKGSEPWAEDSQFVPHFNSVIACMPNSEGTCDQPFKACAGDKELELTEQSKGSQQLRRHFNLPSKGL
jgi:hypothetical protein